MIGAGSTGNNVFVQLVEKAYAKLIGNYYDI